MITFFQEKEIEKYLLGKKISGKLLIEIKDHMVSQILEIQDRKNLNFQKAFEETKEYWSQDLVMVRKNIFSNQKITKIAYELDKISNINLLLKSGFYAFLFICLEFILAIVLDESFYTSFNVVFKIIITFLPFAVMGMYIQQKKLAKGNYKDILVINNFIHPLFVFLITVFLDNLVQLPKDSNAMIYDYINLGSQGEITTYVFAKSIVIGIFLLTLYLFSFFSLRENIRKLKACKKLYNY